MGNSSCRANPVLRHILFSQAMLPLYRTMDLRLQDNKVVGFAHSGFSTIGATQVLLSYTTPVLMRSEATRRTPSKRSTVDHIMLASQIHLIRQVLDSVPKPWHFPVHNFDRRRPLFVVARRGRVVARSFNGGRRRCCRVCDLRGCRDRGRRRDAREFRLFSARCVHHVQAGGAVDVHLLLSMCVFCGGKCLEIRTN